MARAFRSSVDNKLYVTCIFFLLIWAATGFVTEERSRFQSEHAIKRSPRGGFMGLNTMCQLHRRNCVGGFRKRFSKPVEPSPVQPAWNLPFLWQDEDRGQASPDNLLEDRGQASPDNLLEDRGDDREERRGALATPVRRALLELLRRERDRMLSARP